MFKKKKNKVAAKICQGGVDLSYGFLEQPLASHGSVENTDLFHLVFVADQGNEVGLDGWKRNCLLPKTIVFNDHNKLWRINRSLWIQTDNLPPGGATSGPKISL